MWLLLAQIVITFHYFPIISRNGRLNKVKDGKGIAGWVAGGNKIGEYLQVNLGGPKVVTMVASQGREDCCSQWVTKYSLSYSDNASNWTNYELDCIEVRINKVHTAIFMWQFPI